MNGLWVSHMLTLFPSNLFNAGFKVDELVQAWNEMTDADRWRNGVTSSHVEPLFRRRSSKLHSLMENFE